MQIDPQRPFGVTKNDLKKYFGFCLLTSIVNISDTRRYWSPIVGNKLFQETLNCNQFEKIRKYVHLNEITKLLPKEYPNHDHFF